MQVAPVVKNLLATAGDVRDAGSVPEVGRSPGERHGNPLQYSYLENPTDRRAWQATVHGITKNQTQLNTLAHTYTMATERYSCKLMNSGDLPVYERSHEEGNGNPLQYSYLENPMDRGAWQATVCRVMKSQIQLSD